MNRISSSFTLSLAVSAICVFAGMPQAVRAQPAAEGTIDLLTTPPELSAKVSPNVVLTFDDSGSMNWHHMPDSRPYTGGGWGTADDGAQSEAANRTYEKNAWPYLCAGVIRPQEVDSSLLATDPRLWAMNGTYYNADATYEPPIGPDGTQFPNASFAAAWRNGINVNRPVSPIASTTDNLGNVSFCNNKGAGYAYYDGPALTLDANGALTNTTDLYTKSNWKWNPLPAGKQQNFANWYSYYRTRNMAAITSVSRAYAPFDKSIRVAWQNINSNWIQPGITEIFPFEDKAGVDLTRSKFYEWLFKNPAKNSTPLQAAAVRVGELFKEKADSSDTNPYWDRALNRELSCRKNFHIQMTDGFWNGGVKPVSQTDTKDVAKLPDGVRTYSTASKASKIFWNEGSNAQNTMADIAFHYWATNLRPDFTSDQTKLKVRPYLSDRTTGITGTIGLQPGDNWLNNAEIFWNPANDPATWPHLVQFMIGFGVDGTIPKTNANYLKLRKGEIAWPKLDGGSPYTDNAKKIDDMWHAAINSRGEFFAASNPKELIDALQKIIASVIAQSTSSTPAAVSLPILTGGNSAYQGGYDTSGWPGSVRRSQLDAAGEPATVLWDAGCLLTGGACAEPVGTNPARDPATRILITTDGASTGKAFRWGDLNSVQQNALNQKPGAAICTGSGPNCDGYGSDRLDYLRGKRDNELSGANPLLRQRASILGAVVNGEPAYVSSPRSGYHDMFPAGSPEAAAMPDNSYAVYQNAMRQRDPRLYVGSNDGMLHAFNAETGIEEWAFVPNTLIQNGRLANSTVRDAGLVPGVDAKPRERDVFINGAWRTILVGSLRLGGRGVYAVDVTSESFASEAAAATALPLWEFSSGDTASSVADAPCAAGSTTCPSLGYTYDSANVARLKYGKTANNWAVLVSSGYFPSNADAAANPRDRTEAAAKRTSLLVIDLESGKLIREIRTSGAPQVGALGSSFKSFGLSTPVVYDEGSDEVDDLAFAGDLAGNLWRFDLSDEDPARWKVDLMFRTTGNGGAANQGDQPIVFNPTALRDPVTRRPILVVGTGKYLGEDDRTSAIPQQAFYGIRDYGTASSVYPIQVDQLVTQTLDQSAGNSRMITGFIAPSGTLAPGTPAMHVSRAVDNTDPNNPKYTVVSVLANGWRMPLNIGTEKGERAQRRAIPIPTANVALLYGLIPKSDDPCDPGARYSIMALDAATGGAVNVGGGISSGIGLIGAVVSAPVPPSDPVAKRGGGGGIIIGLPPGIPQEVKDALNKILTASIPLWHRGAWRELLDL